MKIQSNIVEIPNLGYKEVIPYYINRASDWTLSQSDANTEQQFNSGSALVCTIETNDTSAIATGTVIPLLRRGSWIDC